jgi:hypothetical protein
MPSNIMLSVILLNVIQLNVMMLSALAPFGMYFQPNMMSEA